jgi:hypothetical protein
MHTSEVEKRMHNKLDHTVYNSHTVSHSRVCLAKALRGAAFSYHLQKLQYVSSKDNLTRCLFTAIPCSRLY